MSGRLGGKGFTRRDRDADLPPDLVRRDFTAHVPNRLWVTDLTMIATEEGPLWLSAIRDAFSRRVVARETSARADADLVLTTLEYALASREVAPCELVHHADHGCRYTSVKLTTRLVRAGIQASVGSVGDSIDFALAENLWRSSRPRASAAASSLLSGRACQITGGRPSLVSRQTVRHTSAEASLTLFEHIAGFCNPAVSRNDSAASAPSNTRSSTTPNGRRPNKRIRNHVDPH